MKKSNAQILLLILFLGVSIVVNAQDVLTEKEMQIHLDRANQILKVLVPDENLSINGFGIVEAENFSVLLDFSISRQLGVSVLTVNEEDQAIELCCISGMEEDQDGNLTEYFMSSSYSIEPHQFSIAKELKNLLDIISRMEE